MTEISTDGIGGFLPLEPTRGIAPTWMRDALAFRSARDAMHAWFTAMAPEHIWLPHYICASAVPAAEGVASVRRYALSDDLGPPPGTPIGPRDVVVLVDYLGLSGDCVRTALHRLGPKRTLVDASQSLGFPATDASHVVYSPRKFLGLPDGGLLVTEAAIHPPIAGSSFASFERCRHLLLRAAGQRIEGLEAFRRAEASLEHNEPAGMSSLTRGLLAHIDVDAVGIARRANFDRLQRILGEPPEPYAAPSAPHLPLAFPVACNRAMEARHLLRERSVFAPHYWPGLPIAEHDPLGVFLHTSVLCLPCDQRYDASHINALAGAVESVLQNLS